tara:strand:- start:560 stop:1264 length:705 start_codon:yes stop_codon:yes gene_type:complete
MKYYKSLNFLKKYVKEEIDTSKLTTEDDSGNRGLILMVQEKYKIDLGLPSENISDLRDAMMVSYPLKDVERLADRDYISDVMLNKNIDIEDYVESIVVYNKIISSQKSIPIDKQTEEGYELTHLVWALHTIVKDNHLLRTYKEFMINSLINLYKRIDFATDVSTETLYFISEIDSFYLQENWIMNLESQQGSNGAFTGETPKGFSKQNLVLLQVHHTSLALLTLYNFYNGSNSN